MNYQKAVVFFISLLIFSNFSLHLAQSNKKISNSESTIIQLVKDIKPGGGDSSPHKFTKVNEDIYFVADHLGYPDSYGIWKTTGWEAGTSLVADLDNPDISLNYAEFTSFNGELFFRGASNENSAGSELWATDITIPEGIRMVKDIYPGGDSGFPNQLTVFGNVLLFFASSTDSEGERTGQELWRSDGTELGTYIVKEIMPGTQPGVGIDGFVSSAILNGIYYFTAMGPGEQIGDEWIGGLELWRSDGTEAGTYIVRDLTPSYTVPYGADWSRPHNITYFKNKIIFSAYGTGFGNELYESDGTYEGTKILKDIFPNDGSGIPCGSSSISSYPSDFIVTTNYIYFFACDGTHGRELWITNGSEEGTRMISDFTPGEEGTIITEAAAFNDKLIFAYDDGDENHGNELWYTDGLKTELIMDIATGVDVFERANNSDPAELTKAWGYEVMYFSAWTPEQGRELWQTDGTPEYTHLVEEMFEGNWGGNPNSLAFFDSTLYFSARSEYFVPGLPSTGYELWKLTLGLTGVESIDNEISFQLIQNYPNPFNPTTTITYTIPKKELVTLKIFDVLGREVQTLVNEEKLKGSYTIDFDASGISSGIYFYSLQSGDLLSTKKLILLK